MIRGFRIIPSIWADFAFSGEGSKRAGGRWNSKGVAVVYASQTLSQAILETLVHLDDAGDLVGHYVYHEIQIPDELLEEVRADYFQMQLTEATPHTLTRPIGDRWVGEGRSAVLKVPSVIVVGEVNYVLNPGHPDFSRIDIATAQPLLIDRRLLRSRPHWKKKGVRLLK